MANLKIQGVTPAAGKIKVGSSDVSKIYKGSTVVWPTATSTYTNQTMSYGWNNPALSSESQVDLRSAVTALATACILNRFYIGLYNSTPSFPPNGEPTATISEYELKYLTTDNFTNGTQLYNNLGEPFGTEGFYVITDVSPTAPAINQEALSPNIPSVPVPDSYKIVGVNDNGTITSIWQYNSPALSCQTHLLLYSFFPVGDPGSAISLQQYDTSSDALCAINSWFEALPGTPTDANVTHQQAYCSFAIGDTFEVGTQLLTFNGSSALTPGVRLIGSLSDPTLLTDCIPCIDPGQPGTPVPDSYQIVVVGANGIITAIDQYNTVTCP
tara:strand:- start:26 stop:1006 length:981 start_codon:yes stop_codon:yes gene_type:complete